MSEQDHQDPELAERVREIIEDRHAFDLSPGDIRDIQQFTASLNGAHSELAAETLARAREIAWNTTEHAPERLNIETPFKGRIAAAEQEAEAAEAGGGAANDAWRTAQRRVRAEGTKRLQKADGNPTKIARAQAWIGAREAEAAALEAEFRAADDTARRSRARLNALRLAADRWRWQERVLIHNPENPSRPLTLAEFEERRKQE